MERERENRDYIESAQYDPQSRQRGRERQAGSTGQQERERRQIQR